MVEQRPIPIVIATRNRGKTIEIRELLEGFPVEIRNLDDFGPIPVIEEDGDSFDENAYKKASFASRVLGLPALADDSGLVVEALGGAPGIRSARYAGDTATDAENCDKLLAEMTGEKNRKAAFECVLSIAVPTGAALTYEGRCDGEIAGAPAGEGGFGYDPIFFHPPSGKTFAQMKREEKNRVSHRGRALGELQREFERVLVWIRRQMPDEEKFACRT